MSFLAFTIMGTFRKEALRLEHAYYRLRRRRYLLLYSIACFVNHARQWILNIACPKTGEHRFKFIMQRTWSL